MSTPDPDASHAPFTEVKVQVPTDRIASFYALMGEWLKNPDAARAPRRRSGGGRRGARAASGFLSHSPIRA